MKQPSRSVMDFEGCEKCVVGVAETFANLSLTAK